MLFVIIFGNNITPVNAVEQHEYTDQYDSDILLSQYSTTEIVAMYPEFSEYLAKELRALNTDIPVGDYNFNKKDIGAIFFSIVIENPDIFYVFPTSFETTATVETDTIISIRPEFFFDIEDIPAKINEFNLKANNILSRIDSSWNNITKARYIHDLLAQYTEYDTKYETISSSDYERYKVQMRIYTAYGALVDNNAVCEGYVTAYNYLLKKAGIKSYYIQSYERRHAWNMIEINGKYYHVDLTHDDPSYDNLGRVNHKNFMKSDKWFVNDDDLDHSSWVTNLKASDTSYDNAWWNSVNTIIYRYNGYDYYINQNYSSSVYAALSRRNTSTGAVDVLKTIKTRWYISGSTSMFWDNAFSYMTNDEKYIYYSDTSTVYRYTLSSGTTSIVYTKPSSVSGDIYGLAFKSNNMLYASIKGTPNAKDVTYKLNITAHTPTNPTNPTDPSDATDPSGTSPTNPSVTTEPIVEPITEPKTEAPKVSPVKISRKITIYIKQTISISLTPKGSYKFSSNKKSIATVTSKGIIKGKKKGKAVITAKSSKAIFTLTITVKNPKLNVTKKTLKKKKSFKLKVIGGSGKITFKISNSKVISVKSNGKVTAKQKGKSTITVKVSGLTLKCKVTVK